VALLVSPTEALRRTPKPSERVPTRLDGLRVLIVDDGDTNRKLIKILLTRAGATVDTAENGQICLDKVAGAEFDAILMDMQMPVLDGYSAAQRLREQGRRLPIIALTAHALKGEEDKCRAAGCDGYLTKPVNRDDLIECVHRMCAAAASLPEAKTLDEAPAVPTMLSDEDLNDPEFRAIAEDFAASLQAFVGDLSQAFHNQDWTDLIGRAHKLKGTAGMVGFPSVGELALQVETAAQSNDSDTLEELLKELDSLSSRLHVPAGA
jgi:CheY-like chemotaxis protein/HPt (histidine-containing phosphotransfer) domain-containing protein